MKLFSGRAVAVAAILGTRLAAGASPLRRPARPHDEEVERPWEVQREVEQTVARMRHLRATAGAETDTRGIARELEHLESNLAARAPLGMHRSSGDASGTDNAEKELQVLDTEIGAVRAKLCLEQGMSDADCEGFMRKACDSQGATMKQALPQDITLEAAAVTQEMCQQFFLDHRTAVAKKTTSSRSGKSKDQPAEKPAKEALKTEEKPEETEEAASKPEEKTAPAKPEKAPPAPEPKASTEENSGNGSAILGGKKERPLPSQGYNEFDGGRLVEHDDNSTVTEDWMHEFGADSGHRDVYTICKEHPDNEWCRLHSYHEPAKSNVFRRSCPRLAVVASAALLAYL